ncbi:hypothetical protein RIF29_22774 [Crotalaria pallida]|uniref:Protein kinase domain-containing protein n=1 Tax=Crotalaria pallida TaxID=3830 RepID=A0AAN9F505_CROPI
MLLLLMSFVDFYDTINGNSAESVKEPIPGSSLEAKQENTEVKAQVDAMWEQMNKGVSNKIFRNFTSKSSSMATKTTKKTSSIKCYMQQLLLGLKHCEERGVMHRDIKPSNLLIDKRGMLKIADFGLSHSFDINPKGPLTNRVVTLWYRAPELLLGSTDYGYGIDLWSAGCLLAEMFVGRPIMPGRTETADCLADNIAEQFKNQPCTNTTGAKHNSVLTR